MAVASPINCNKSVLQIHLCHRKKRKSTVNGYVLHWLKASNGQKIATTTTIRMQKRFTREKIHEKNRRQHA